MNRRCCIYGLLIAAGLSATAAPSSADTGPIARSDVEAVIADARSATMVDPQLGLDKAFDIQALSRKLSSAKDRDWANASALWLQGDAALRLGRPEEARFAIKKARALAERVLPHSKLMGDILLSSGSINAIDVRVAQALEEFQNAYRVFGQTKDRRRQAISLVYIAMLYDDAKDYASSQRYLEQAYETFSGDKRLAVSILNNRGTSLAALNRTREAIQQFDQALLLARQMQSAALQAQILRNTIRAYLSNKDLDAAERIAPDAIRVARNAGGRETAATLSAIAQLAHQRGRDKEALALITRSFAEDDLSASTLLAREAHATAYRIYAAAHDAPKALAHLEALKRLDDESTKLATQTSNALMGARFDYANQELRIANLKAEELRRKVAFEQERARFERTVFAVASAAALALMGVLGWSLFTVRRSRNAVRAANDELSVTNESLTRALAAKTEFLAMTSHEIRTPLNGILGMTQVMLAGQDLDEGARERVQIVHSAGETMRALVDDILDVAKIENGRMTLETAPFDMAEVLRDAASLWEEQLRTKGVRLDVRVDLSPGQVLGDAARLRQIIFNLLSNAVKFTERGSIGLTATRDGAGVHRISVSDTGIGIPESKLEEVFEPFKQADASTTRRFGGTGLGLSISRSLARAMGGELSVTSEAGRGSTFTLTAMLKDHVEKKPEAAPAFEGDTLLVIDRNPIMRAMFRTLFEPHAARVEIAASLEEADRVLAEDRPRRVLIDEAALAPDALRGIIAAAHAAGSVVTLLRAREAPPSPVDGVSIVTKPVSGPALVGAMFSQSSRSGDPPAIVSRAA